MGSDPKRLLEVAGGDYAVCERRAAGAPLSSGLDLEALGATKIIDAISSIRSLDNYVSVGNLGSPSYRAPIAPSTLMMRSPGCLKQCSSTVFVISSIS